MRKLIFCSLFALMTLSAFSQTYKSIDGGVKCTVQGMDVVISYYSPSIIRVYKTPQGTVYDKKSQIVIMPKGPVIIHTESEGNWVKLKSTKVQVKLDLVTGGITFYDIDGNLLARDKDYGTSFAAIDDAGTPSYRVRGSFLLDRNEPIYGIGQVMDGKLNRRNSIHHIQNENMFTYSPYFLSLKGYGVYWDNYSVSDFVDTPQDLSFTSIGHCADYYFMYGSSADGVISQVRTLTGKAPMLPLWAYGYFQSKERYVTQDESLNVLKTYRKLGVPIDCMIQDWQYWPQYSAWPDSAWHSFSFDPQRFPEPVKWISDIHHLNAKLMIVAWPAFGPKTEMFQEFKSKGMLLDFVHFPGGETRPYDVYNPEARDIYWKYMSKGIFNYIHNDGWWLDATEPDMIEHKESDLDKPTYAGSFRSVKNIYCLLHNGGIATHQKAQSKDKRIVMLTRSGFIGQQRYGSITWSGDVTSSWDVFAKQIPAALNFTMMGIPNWNSDIGGFFAGSWVKDGGDQNPGFQDLYSRWLQFGAFCPMMRSHGTSLPREIYNFGKRGDWCFDAIERSINLRYHLLPYIYSTSWDVSNNNGTFMRALVMDFPKDANTYDLGSEYLFGRSILVSPITKPNVNSWSVYLPKGADWWDFWNNKILRGGQTVARALSKDILPLYVKAGSILPFGPKVQYSGQDNWGTLEIRIYPGHDGDFVLYEDERDNYNYEKGLYSTIEFRWNNAKRELTIGDRKGQFPNMLKNRKFNVVLINITSGVGDHSMKGKMINYTGNKKIISF
jgi:alpha-D-xyloside xylohydrolase